jgi:hypothetical protein
MIHELDKIDPPHKYEPPRIESETAQPQLAVTAALPFKIRARDAGFIEHPHAKFGSHRYFFG